MNELLQMLNADPDAQGIVQMTVDRISRCPVALAALEAGTLDLRAYMLETSALACERARAEILAKSDDIHAALVA